jgi:hypothetical protein
MNEWISVDDGLPASGSRVITFSIDDGESFVEWAYFNGGRFESPESDAALVGVTHWMRLPDPPKV